jgi:hypothetical protein
MDNLPATRPDGPQAQPDPRPPMGADRPVSVALVPLAIVSFVILAFVMAVWTFAATAF